jgi:hypothetical protein
VYEWSAAELFMQTAFSSNFRSQHKDPRLALALSAGPRFFDSSYYEYLTKLHDPSLSLAIQAVLQYLLSDFRNALPQKRMKDFERAYKNGTLTVEMLQDLINFIHRPGGLRKPDILGIIAEGEPGRMELHEVCTVGGLRETKKELDEKLQQLRTQVIPPLMKELRGRQTELRMSPSDPLIHSFSAEASHWVPPPSLRTCPLGVWYDPRGNTIKVKWACFEPAVDPTTELLVTPGLLPYHIHEMSGPPLDEILPVSVRLDLKRWEGELARAAGLRPLQLLPEMNPVIHEDLLKLSLENRRMIAYSSAALFVLILCVVAAPIVLDAFAGLSAAGGATGASVAGGAGTVVSAPALISEMPTVVATTQGLAPLAEQYAISLVRAAARAAAQAPPPPL